MNSYVLMINESCSLVSINLIARLQTVPGENNFTLTLHIVRHCAAIIALNLLLFYCFFPAVMYFTFILFFCSPYDIMDHGV